MILLIFGALVLALIVLSVFYMTSMPGSSFQGALPAFQPEEKQLANELRGHVLMLSATIGERNIESFGALTQAATYIEKSLTNVGYQVRRLPFTVDGRTVENLEVEIRGTSPATDVVVFGAHYDSTIGTPGANDNASGTAGLLALARLAHAQKFERTVRFVFFVNEEPPYFQRESMGSLVYARALKLAGVKVTAMFSLETIGYFTDEKGSQKYPFPFDLLYPDTGNFVAFVGDLQSRRHVRQAISAFRKSTAFPSEGVAAPAAIPGIGWSDHWAFWQVGYPGVMVTDTAIYRYPHYHRSSDTVEKLDYDRMARIVLGLKAVLTDSGSATAAN